MNENKSKEGALLKVIIGSITGLFIAFIAGTYTMITSNDKRSEVFATQLKFISQNVTYLRSELKDIQHSMSLKNAEMWTKNDHIEYDKRVQSQFNYINKRIERMEQKK